MFTSFLEMYGSAMLVVVGGIGVYGWSSHGLLTDHQIEGISLDEAFLLVLDDAHADVIPDFISYHFTPLGLFQVIPNNLTTR